MPDEAKKEFTRREVIKAVGGVFILSDLFPYLGWRKPDGEPDDIVKTLDLENVIEELGLLDADWGLAENYFVVFDGRVIGGVRMANAREGWVDIYVYRRMDKQELTVDKEDPLTLRVLTHWVTSIEIPDEQYTGHWSEPVEVPPFGTYTSFMTTEDGEIATVRLKGKVEFVQKQKLLAALDDILAERMAKWSREDGMMFMQEALDRIP